MPLALRVVLVVLLALSVLRACLGPPPRRLDPSWAGVPLAGAFAAGSWALVAHAAGSLLAVDLLLVACVELACLATWLRRAPGDGGGGSGEPGAPGEPPPGVDWERFDRERSAWAPRRREPVA